ncbi:MAG TPA: nuclear transport factor 2 family protein [Candidatus Sulfotelmatobacter sp.]|nr:nuclear transport factor 2 family protein [Candidatus Sulfotelmatobacter sp.]
MKKSLLWSLLGFFLLVSAAWSQAQQTEGAEKAVAKLEEQWLQAIKTNNPDLVAPLLADKFVSTSGVGKVTGKANALADVKSIKWSRAEYTDLKVTVFYDTAIATGGLRGTGIDASGKLFDLNVHWTDTWVKVPKGTWQCVASHASAVSM